MSPAQRPPPSHNWPAILGGALALVGIVAYLQERGQEEGQDKTSITAMSNRMDEGFAQMRRDLDRIDQNGVTRRAELRDEMGQLHTQQQRDLDELRDEMKMRRDQ